MEYLLATHTLKYKMAEAMSLVQSIVYVSYHEFDEANDKLILPPFVSRVKTNNTTRVDIVTPSAHSKQINSIELYNDDDIEHTYLFSHDDGSSVEDIVAILLSPGSSAHWSKINGWTVVNTSGVPNYVLTAYTSSGSFTVDYTARDLFVLAIGGGGGAGSGMRGAASTNRFGGGAGQGGAMVYRRLNPRSLPTDIVINVGSKGIGGLGQTVDSTNGNPGTAGGDSEFGAYVKAKGGNPGLGGTTAAGTPGNGALASSCIPAYGPYVILPGNGGAGSTNATATTGTQGLLGNTGTPGGGGATGINNTNVSGTVGGQGGGVIANGISILGPSSASPNGVSNLANFLMFETSLTTGHGIGSAGAGGTSTQINGGNGGNYGAGGGGGAATLNGTTSGKGGDGGDGLVLVLAVY